MDGRTRLCLLISAGLLFSLCLFYLSNITEYDALDAVSGDNAIFRAQKRNVFSELTKSEANEVYDFLSAEWADLNLTTTPQNGRDNYIYRVEALQPNKTDAVSYLYGQKSSVDRWAKVTLSRFENDSAYLSYHMVGPLGASTQTKVLPLQYPFNSGRNWVHNWVHDYIAIQDFVIGFAQNVSDITQDLIDASVNIDDPNDPKGLIAMPRSYSTQEGVLSLWAQFYRKGNGSGGKTLLPQGIYVKVDGSGSSMDNWVVVQLYYNGIMYANEHELRAAIKKPGFEKTPPNLDGPWTDTEDFEAAPQGRELPPPVLIQPYGPRYRLDREQKYVSWFGFEFFLSTNAAQGVTVHDIRFKGERVMYELGLQEAMAHYAGDDPLQGGLEWMDSFFGMGKNAFELLPGYDCPAYADYLDSQYHENHRTTTVPNNLCIFEYTADHLLSRHTAQYSVTASRNTYLVVRSVSTVGNYDYTIDYIFYLDGSLEVKIRASGYIFAAFSTANQTDDSYGHRVHDALSTSMHDHVINFKADLDVAGTQNDMVRLAIEPTALTYPWDLPEIKERNTMHLVEYPIVNETGLDWPANSGEFYIVYSSTQTNAWGERKGYRVTSGTGMGSTPHLAILNSTTLGNSARWAEKDIWVLRRKDTEPRSADPLNVLEPQDPVVDFTKMANGESLNRTSTQSGYDGDLVLYFNLGAHHIPHSGDIPNTLMHTSASSVMFVPHNFNDRDPSRESVQGVRLQLKGKDSGGFAGEENVDGDLKSREQRGRSHGQPKAYHFGGTYEAAVKVPLEQLEPTFDDHETFEHEVTDLSVNGSAAGTWHREEA